MRSFLEDARRALSQKPSEYWPIHAKMDTDIHEHLETLYLLAKQYHSVVEFGVRMGESTIALLEGARSVGGWVFSADIEDCPIARKRIRRYGLSGDWRFVVGNSLEVPIPRANLFFLDTSHQYTQTLGELSRAEASGASCIAVHDTNAPLWPNVPKAIETFNHDRRWHYEERKNCYGLGILTR